MGPSYPYKPSEQYIIKTEPSNVVYNGEPLNDQGYYLVTGEQVHLDKMNKQQDELERRTRHNPKIPPYRTYSSFSHDAYSYQTSF